jgi:phosphoglycerate kinase
MRSVREADFSGERVLLRADLDVPCKEGKVQDDRRLKAAVETVNYLCGKGGRVLIIGHLGRPGGKRDEQFSLRPIAERLASLCGRGIPLAEDFEEVGSFEGAKMLENLRFWPGEEANQPAFVKKLSSLGDIYVNDSFASSHRAHASVVGVAGELPSFVGFCLEQEIRRLARVLDNPKRPLVFMIGGAKVETKEPLVVSFAKIADKVLLGGRLMFSQKLRGTDRVVFPVDAVDTYDIGPKTAALFSKIVKESKTVVWNGPLGKWEEKGYEKGTLVVARNLLNSSAEVVVGGGDTLAFLDAFDLYRQASHVSLGGGAMLEFLAGEKLPGLVALGYY